MIRRATVLFPALLLTLLLPGCFRYVPVTLDTAPEGQDVRVIVTRDGASELREVADVASEVPTLTGRFMGFEDRNMLLRVPVGQRQAGFHTVSLDQTIRIPSGEVLQIERREFDRGRTALLAGGAVAGSVFIIASIMQAFGGDTSGPGDPGPPESRIPIPFASFVIGR